MKAQITLSPVDHWLWIFFLVISFSHVCFTSRIVVVASAESSTSSSSSSSSLPLFPKPQDIRCQSGRSNRICNRDNILSLDDVESIDSMIQDYLKSTSFEFVVLCQENNNNNNGNGKIAIKQKRVSRRLEMGVYIQQWQPQRSGDDQQGDANTIAATILHEWGLGSHDPLTNTNNDNDSNCGGGTLGILLYMAVDDNQMVFSTTKEDALIDNTVLFNDHVLQQIMTHMKPLLEQYKFADAIRKAILELTLAIRAAEQKQEDPLENNITNDNIDWKLASIISWFLAAMSVLCWFGAWFFMLHRLGQMELSCPCLERLLQHVLDLVGPLPKKEDTDETENQQILPNCNQQWYMTRFCPICLESFSTFNFGSDDDSDDNNNKHEETPLNWTRMMDNSEKTSVGGLVGSDGRPILLLPCGHCFDATCLSRWMSTSSSSPLNNNNNNNTSSSSSVCPICRAVVPKNYCTFSSV